MGIFEVTEYIMTYIFNDFKTYILYKQSTNQIWLPKLSDLNRYPTKTLLLFFTCLIYFFNFFCVFAPTQRHASWKISLWVFFARFITSSESFTFFHIGASCRSSQPPFSVLLFSQQSSKPTPICPPEGKLIIITTRCRKSAVKVLYVTGRMVSYGCGRAKVKKSLRRWKLLHTHNQCI